MFMCLDIDIIRMQKHNNQFLLTLLFFFMPICPFACRALVIGTTTHIIIFDHK